MREKEIILESKLEEQKSKLVFTLDDMYSKEVVDESIDVVETDGILFYRPKVEIFAGKEMITRRYFETFEEAQKWCTKEFPNVRVI